jgi:hypothetical protein
MPAIALKVGCEILGSQIAGATSGAGAPVDKPAQPTWFIGIVGEILTDGGLELWRERKKQVATTSARDFQRPGR